jgi:hypothetical protein
MYVQKETEYIRFGTLQFQASSGGLETFPTDKGDYYT